MLTSFFPLDSHHAELAALFADHQEALLDRRFADALVLLRRFRSSFATYARDREPRFAGLDLDAFRIEYRALHHILEELGPAIREAAIEDRASALIAVLDRETKFKEMLQEFESGPASAHGH